MSVSINLTELRPANRLKITRVLYDSAVGEADRLSIIYIYGYSDGIADMWYPETYTFTATTEELMTEALKPPSHTTIYEVMRAFFYDTLYLGGVIDVGYTELD